MNRLLHRDRCQGIEVGFLGRTGTPAERLFEAVGYGGRVAWLHQVHSNRVLAASPGLSGTGDGLYTERARLGLTIATADCVPVLLSDGRRIAAVHAGWRGIALGVVQAALARYSPETGLTAWIGPAVGPCCYEVSEAVAVRVAATSSGEAIVCRPGERPHLDLGRAVQEQLTSRGVEDVRTLRRCTRCHPELASYRRDGAGAGRNWALIWRPA